MDWDVVPDGVNFSFPKNTASIEVSLSVTTPDKSGCRMRLRGKHKTDLVYFSQSGKVTGNDHDTNYDLNISKGWNVFYNYYDVNGVRYQTTDLSKTGDTWEWQIDYCDDD
jgi:hypothetical protein